MKSKIINFTTQRLNSTGQVIIVILAFFLMVVSSYLYTSRIENDHLVSNAKSTLAGAQSFIEADLLEASTTLAGIAEAIRHMILNDNDYESIQIFLTDLTGYMQDEDDRMSYMMGAYGVFDCFGGQFHAGNGWVPADDYVPQNRPWYEAAISAQGEVGVTEPYLDLSMGLITISFARQIFDDDGHPLGVVVLDVMLERIADYVINTKLTEDSYGVLFDRNLEIVVHPNSSYLGRNLNMIENGEAIASDLNDGLDFGMYDWSSYLGDRSSIFFKRLDNGWILGTVTPTKTYFQSLTHMAIFLTVLGICLAAILSLLLIMINRAKDRATKRVQVMFDTMPMCANFWTKDGKHVDCNLEAVRFFDLTSKEEYSTRFFELSPECQPCGRDSNSKALHYVTEAFEHGYARFEWIHRNPNSGALIPCEITLIRAEFGNEYIVAGYTRDLRDEKEMIEKLQSVTQERTDAEAANLAKSSFLAAMSHEIRSPMNAILGITEIQLQDAEISETVQEGLLKIHDAGYTLLHIINDMLDLSKIEAGKMEVKKVKYDVPSLINDTVHMNIMRLGSRTIDFKLELDETIPSELIGDELRIKQILNNLLSNAFKYTDMGVITMGAAVEYIVNKPYVKIIFTISDTGRGMTQEQISKIFDEYTRFNSEESRAIEGVGLGMTIVQRLLDIMKGEIYVESELDVGSTFTVSILQDFDGAPPIGSDMVKQLQEFSFHGRCVKGADIVREHMPYGKVLIVDDVDTNLFVAKGFLAPYGLKIDMVRSGFEAIDKIRSGGSYDIIFMDHMMPQMDGIEAAKLIRLMGYKKPIVALTANALVGKAEMFMENGFDDFISKPIDIRHLNTCLNKLIRDRHPTEEVNAARRELEAKKLEVQNAKTVVSFEEMMDVFTKDALGRVAILENIHEYGYRRGDDIKLFIMAIQGIRLALQKIDKTELALLASKIENAGIENDIEMIKENIPGFLADIKVLINK
ncbi:MAG: ATP-binding protein [Lachnospiraceae bacterium]|nr:ATP-binding protein [Lachnospiraceae bacterium]